jgi:hypothetical protein
MSPALPDASREGRGGQNYPQLRNTVIKMPFLINCREILPFLQSDTKSSCRRISKLGENEAEL